MTHEDARDLLPLFALGALDRDVAELEVHLDACARCREELAAHLEVAAALASAVEPVLPPPSLRAAVLAAVPHRAGESGRRFRLRMPTGWIHSPALAAAVVLLVAGVAAFGWSQHRRLDATESALLLEDRGLSLLTSTETLSARLNPVTEPGARMHGHWYHRPGVPTQVLVIEFMPPLSPGEAYYGWMQEEDLSWRACGPFPPGAAGHGRLVLTGDDGSRVRSVVVSRQPRPTASPSGEMILRWTAP